MNTPETVAAVTDRPAGEGLIITRHLDYSLPYRTPSQRSTRELIRSRLRLTRKIISNFIATS